jgi:hypothetical protein
MRVRGYQAESFDVKEVCGGSRLCAALMFFGL